MKNDSPKKPHNNKNRTRGKKVAIKAKNVIVNGPKNKRRNRPGPRGRHKANPPPGVETGLANLGSDCTEAIPPPAAAFIETYIDPCGEHQESLDAGRVPDGALQSSCALYFRDFKTIDFPFQEVGTVALDGKTYSMLLLQFPFLRSLSVLVVRATDGEFDDELMELFCNAFALATPLNAVYPKWSTITGTDSFTIIDTATMRSIIPPSPQNGISPTIESYRFSSQGVEILFNTPDLINQGSIVSMRYPSDISERSIVGAVEADALPVTAISSATLQLNTNNFSLDISGALVTINGTNTRVLPDFTGFSTSLPSAPFVVPAGVIIRTATGAIFASAGASIQYRLDTTNSRRVNLGVVSTVTNSSIILVQGTNAGQVTNSITEFFIEAPGAGNLETEGDSNITVLSLPPVTQGAMLQANPKSCCNLMKEFDGVYLPSSIMQPVINVTHASSYRKCVLANKTVNLQRAEYIPVTGWFDTVDQNFSVAVINMQGIPYACKPILKINRSVEAVPSSDSILGAVTVGCPEKCAEAVDICQAFTELQPHGFPPAYNGLGLLFSKVANLVGELNVLDRDARNIGRVVNNACKDTWQAARTVRGMYHSLKRNL